VDAYTCSESPGLLGHIFTGISCRKKQNVNLNLLFHLKLTAQI
jgi:hypothetical protein